MTNLEYLSTLPLRVAIIKVTNSLDWCEVCRSKPSDIDCKGLGTQDDVNCDDCNRCVNCWLDSRYDTNNSCLADVRAVYEEDEIDEALSLWNNWGE